MKNDRLDFAPNRDSQAARETLSRATQKIEQGKWPWLRSEGEPGPVRVLVKGGKKVSGEPYK